MPQKEARARTSVATSVRAAGTPGISNRAAPRRSPRLLSLLEDSGGATTRSPQLPSLGGAGKAGPSGGDRATPCGRWSSRIRSSVDCCSGPGPAGGVAATPCRRSARLLSSGGHGGDVAGPPDSKREGGHSARSRRQAPQISSLRRSLRLAKSAMDSDGSAYADAAGGGDTEGDCRRRSARLRCSILEGLTGELKGGSGSDERGRNLGRARKVTKKVVSEIPTRRVSKGPGRAEVESAVSKESRADVSVGEQKKMVEIAVVPVTEGSRDKKRKQTMVTQEQLVLERRGFEGGSGCPEWTNEQEMELQRAYILAKPSPHFWKKVAKLVPGKSAQECFDKIHSKIATPVPMQPRSRSKTIDCSPLGFSDLLKKGTRMAKSSKRKSRLHAHKTARHILRKHSIMDKGQEADLFSVLETSPNMHADLFSQVKMPWSPGCMTASPQLLQRSAENLSSGHKKARSRFKSQVPLSYASPEVLKPVKNILMHEKYIDELHCREARRRMRNKTACSVGAEDDKENAIVKDGIVKAAKNALVSEAKGIMCRLEHPQSSPSSNSEDIYDCEDECEEDM